MNRKATIGEGLTWAVSFFIILFILLIFLAAVVSLSTRVSKVDISAQNNFEFGEFGFNEKKFIMEFIELNYGEISQWADSDDAKVKFSEYGDPALLSMDNFPNAQPFYEKLNKNYLDLLIEYKFENSYFYIRTEDREMWVDEKGWFAAPDYNYFRHPMGEFFIVNRMKILEPMNKFFIDSEKGNLVMICFYQDIKDVKGFVEYYYDVQNNYDAGAFE